MNDDDDPKATYISDAAQNVMYFLRLLEPESYAKVYQAIYGCALGTMIVIAGPMINGARSILHVRVVKKDDDGTFDVEPPLH